MNLSTIPKTFEEGVKLLVSGVNAEDKEYLRRNGISGLHHGFGTALRNHWGLWNPDSPIVADFRQRFKVFGHADDVSGLLLHCANREIVGLPWEEEKEIEGLRQHWIKQGLDPVTGNEE